MTTSTSPSTSPSTESRSTPDLYARAFVTRATLDRWRLVNRVTPSEPLAIFFGCLTALSFVDGLDPRDFDLHVVPLMDDGYVRFELRGRARFKFDELYPDSEKIFP